MYTIAKNKYIPFIIAIPLFFCVHSYRGIILDAILYLLQYVSTVDPQRFTDDPAFAFGNQDSYGVFSPILGLFVRSLGVDKGMRCLCWLLHLSWAISAVLLVKSFCKFSRNRLWLIPFLLLFIVCTADGMPHTKVHFFKLVENYTCSRALSLALAFAGFASLLQNKKVTSVLLFLIGTAIHPLTAGWGLPFWLLFFYPKTRILLLVISALFPFLAFLHIGKFDFYPLDWLRRPLSFTPPSDMIVRNCVWFLFYGFLVPRFFPASPLAKLGKTILVVSLIAFYWNLWSGFGEHIFLYQVQTWRAEWIPSVFSFLFCFVLTAHLFKNIRKKRIDSFDCSKFLAIIAVLSPINMLSVAVAAAFLARKKNFSINILRYTFLCLGYFIIAGLLIQQYVVWCQEGGPAFVGFDYHYLYKLHHSLLLNQAIFAFICSLLLICKKKFLFIVPLAVFFFFPQFQLLPLFVVVWFGAKSAPKYILAIVVLLTIFDCIYNTNYREHSLFVSLPSSLYKNVGFALLSIVALKATAMLLEKKFILFAPSILMMSIMGGYAYAHWDGRDGFRIEAEAKINGYLKETIFPQERNRGRILFFVEGPIADARLQFLSGAYLSESTHVGELFFEGHYKETKKRENLLFYKEYRGISHSESDYPDFVKNKMAVRDTLIDRTLFLCKKNDIDNLITSELNLPFAKKDSVLIDNKQWIYLYGCP